MTYNFDEVIERRGTDSVKWDGVKTQKIIMAAAMKI